MVCKAPPLISIYHKIFTTFIAAVIPHAQHQAPPPPLNNHDEYPSLGNQPHHAPQQVAKPAASNSKPPAPVQVNHAKPPAANNHLKPPAPSQVNHLKSPPQVNHLKPPPHVNNSAQPQPPANPHPHPHPPAAPVKPAVWGAKKAWAVQPGHGANKP